MQLTGYKTISVFLTFQTEQQTFLPELMLQYFSASWFSCREALCNIISTELPGKKKISQQENVTSRTFQESVKKLLPWGIVNHDKYIVCNVLNNAINHLPQFSYKKVKSWSRNMEISVCHHQFCLHAFYQLRAGHYLCLQLQDALWLSATNVYSI